MNRREKLAETLEEVRARTLALMARVPDDLLRVRVHEFYSPVGWHFGHVGRTEEYWACHVGLGRPLADDRLSFLFADLPDNPKDARVAIPDRTGILAYLAETRRRTLDALASADLGSDDPCLRDGFAFDFAAQHEMQHQETILEMLQLLRRVQGVRLDRPAPPASPGVTPGFVPIPGGTFRMGDDDPMGYDNERDAHEVTVAPFELGRYPVTVAEWRAFADDGGYARPELWTPEGWAWRDREGATGPDYRCEDGWTYGPDGARPLHPDEPVCSISAHEADAYARWAGARLPTEAEWEFARRRADVAGAVHGGLGDGPRPVGGGEPSADGVHDLAGNVWEWTSSPFLAYPGFRAFPYDGYSKDHMKGAHRVCRGGSWATAAPILRPSFRNWYVPTYRQGFLGVRLARG